MTTPPDLLDFSGRRVLVVGGSSGIGNGIARAFLARGARVHVWGTRPGAADDANEPGSQLDGLHYTQVDVADTARIAAVPLGFDRLDVLVQAQGTVLYDRQECETAGFERVLAVNRTSLMACAARCHAALKAAVGAMVVVSSAAAFHSTRGNPAYNASKTGAFGLTRALAEAWASDGIRVNGIAPGLVETKLTRITTAHPKRLDAALRRIPLGRLGTPQDMAHVALFLASPMGKVRKDISAVKAAMLRLLHDIVARALHPHGSVGVSQEMPFAGLVNRAFQMGLADGPTAVHKATVARQLLRGYQPSGSLFPACRRPTPARAAREKFKAVLG